MKSLPAIVPVFVNFSFNDRGGVSFHAVELGLGLEAISIFQYAIGQAVGISQNL